MDIFLREAEKIDISDMYKHLNREFVKKYSCKEKEEWFLHKKRYVELIENPNIKIFIINDLQLRLLGIIKLNFEGDIIGINIFILEKFRNLGVAKIALNKIIRDYNGKILLAEILRENEISINLFKKCGFEVEEVKEDYIKLLRKKS